MQNKIFFIFLGISLYVFLYLSFLLLNTDTCTQGRIDFYVYSTIKIASITMLIVFFEIRVYKVVLGNIEVFNILKIISIIISSIQTMPYLIYTTIRGITICQGSSEWGGFSNKYGLEEILVVKMPIERVLPIIFILTIIVVVILLVIENLNCSKRI